MENKINNNTGEEAMKNLSMTKFREVAYKMFKQLSLYAAILLVGAAVTAFYIEQKPVEQEIHVFRAGEVSVSINEKEELTFIDRDSGEPLVVDSTLTAVINNMLAAREYVKVNTMR